MTEAEEREAEQAWLSSRDPGEMCRLLAVLTNQTGHPTSRRKWRLFLVACLRRIEHRFRDERNRKLVDAIERLADGLLTEEELEQLWLDAGDPPNLDCSDSDDESPVSCACHALSVAATNTVDAFEATTGASWVQNAAEDGDGEAQAQADLLRDIFDNPFRPVPFCPGWRTPAVRDMAVNAYEERDLSIGHLTQTRLAVLADALEEAGCTDARILAHCRKPDPHVRGCWVVDLILSKDR